jgi:hypothetical protein
MGAAREKVRVARTLGTLPRLAKALARGEVSYAKVRALTRVATPETEERLLGVGRAGTAEHVERIVRGWRRVDRDVEARESATRHRSRASHVYRNEDGMVAIRGRLEPEVGELLIQALAAARETLDQRTHRTFAEASSGDVPAETPALEQQQADALALLAETALHHGIDVGAPGERYQVVVHVDAPGLADPEAPGQSVLQNGEHVPAETSRRLACDASRVVMQHARDGPTTLSNLALLCRRHHRAVHEEGYQVARDAGGGELRFRRPDGQLVPEVPRTPKVPADPVTVLRAQNHAQELILHARTGMPFWRGERLDVGYAIDVLHPLARGE